MTPPRSWFRKVMLLTGSLAMFSVAVMTQRVSFGALPMVLPLFYLFTPDCTRAGIHEGVEAHSPGPEEVP